MLGLISMWLSRLSLLFLFACAASTSLHQPVSAQAWQCRAPENLPRPNIEIPKPGEIKRTPVAGYTLSLSWSPEYCKSKGWGGKPNGGGKSSLPSSLQCARKMGEFGFILHGLWPDAAGPDYPRYCRAAPVLSRAVIAQNICMTPDVQLLQHEWAKHGTCMARRPEAYFAAAKLMYDAIEFPDMDRLSRAGSKQSAAPLTAKALAQAFADINEGLPASAVAISTSGRGWLKEVRICLGKKFRPVTCPAFSRGARPGSVVKIWRGT
jgi:ribonuclease T2